MQLGDVNANAEVKEEGKIKTEVLVHTGLNGCKCYTMAGELEKSKANLNMTIYGRRKVD